MTGKQLYDRAGEIGALPVAFAFNEISQSAQAAWNQLAKEASVNVADELGSAMQHERFGG